MIEVEVEDPAWLTAAPNVVDIVREAGRAAMEGWDGDGVVVLLTDNESVRALNARFRDKDAPTNVLSFPALENPESHLGDIALAFEVCAQEAAEQEKALRDHVRHLVIHGVLHLLGYDHQEDGEAERMEALERDLLAGLGVSDPYAPGNDGQHTS